jgi:hypothetical protein
MATVTPTGEVAETQNFDFSTGAPTNAQTSPPATAQDPVYLPGVSDTSLLDKFKAFFTPTDSGLVSGGAGPDAVYNSAAPQDVPRGDSRSITDGTATTANQQTAPSTMRLLFNTITLGYAGPTLFSCRPDSWFCAGTSGITSPNPPIGLPSSGNITTWLVLAVVGLVLVLLLVRRLDPV